MKKTPREYMVDACPPYFDAICFTTDDTQAENCPKETRYYKIVMPIEGSATYVVGEKKYLLTPGDIVVLPRSTHQLIPAQPKYKRCVVWFTADAFSEMDITNTFIKTFSKIDNIQGAAFYARDFDISYLRRLINLLVEELDFKKNLSDVMALSLLSAICVSITRLLAEYHIPLSRKEQDNHLIDDVMKYINDNLTMTLSLDIIAEKFFVSKFHLERVFKKYTGLSIHSYIVQRRLLLSRRYLYTGTTPAAVSRLCGFSDYSTFYRSFKKAYGHSPKEFIDNIPGMQ